MVHKSNTAFLEPKMLLLCIFLVSCCLPGSKGGAIEEFEANLKVLVALANKEVFLPVPKGKFQIFNQTPENIGKYLFPYLYRNRVDNSHVPCQLERTIEGLKLSFQNNTTRTRISLMEKNMDHIASTLKKTHTQPENTRSCLMRDLPQQTALKHFTRYFQKVHENCWES